jgi:PAS domain S-box-containing protein
MQGKQHQWLRALRRPVGVAMLVVLAGLFLSAHLAQRQAEANLASADRRFQMEASHLTEQMMARVLNYEKGVRGARGAHIVTGDAGPTRAQFLSYARSRDFEAEYPGVRGFGIIRRVAPEQESTFVEAMRRGGSAGFSVRRFTSHPGDRYVIQYIEPEARNLPAIGLDIASDAVRREAAHLAMRTGNATLTAPITLVQTTGRPEQSFLLLLPIYREGLPTDTQAQRESATLGWAYAPLSMEEVLGDFRRLAPESIITVTDVTTPGASRVIYGPLAEERIDPLVHTQRNKLYGRDFIFEIRPRAGYLAALNQTPPQAVMVTGVLLSCLLGLLSLLMLREREQMRRSRSRDRRLLTILENTSDAVVTQDPDGIVRSWNRAAERLFGYPSADVIGRPLAHLLLAPDAAHEDAALRAGIVARADPPPFEARRRHRDGYELDVVVTACAITASNGRVVGIAQLFHDNAQRKAAERQLRDFGQQMEQRVTERTAQLEQARRDLRATLDASHAMVAYWDRNLTNRFANRGYLHWFNADPESLTGTHMRDLLGAERFERNRAYVEGALAGAPQTFERSMVLPGNGEVRQTLVHYVPDIQGDEVRGFYAFVHDVTDLTESRRVAAQALREQEALLRTLDHHVIVSAADPSGAIMHVSEAFCRISGFSREELMGQDHKLLNSGTHTREFWADFWRTLRAGKPWTGEICNRAKDGSLYWVDSIIAPFHDEAGNLVKYVSIRRDITLQRTHTELLDRERERLDNILRGTNAGTWEWNIETGSIKLDEHWAQILGYRSADLAARGIGARVNLSHPEELDCVRDQLRRHLSGELPYYEAECRLRHADGRWVWVRDSGRVSLRDAGGRALRMHGTLQDISARKAAEAALAERERLMHLAINAFPGVMAYWDRDMRCIFANEANRAWRGIGPEEMLGRHKSELYGDDTFEEHRPLIRDALRGEARKASGSRKGADGQPMHYILHFLPDRRDGEVQGFISVAIDVTELRRAQAELEVRTDQAERANAAKSHFLANMSHEIRTPLNAIIGLSYLLSQTSLNADQHTSLSQIQVAGRSLLGVINDVLDISKIEAGEMHLEEEFFDLRELLEQVSQMLGSQAERKGLQLNIDIGAEVPRILRGDSSRLRQILVNLVSNAIKFTERGSVSVQIGVAERNPQRAVLSLSVHDTGIGIAPQAQTRLFNAFQQADESTTRRYGGTGLGLSIVRNLATLMGGEVGVSSQPGKGSEFWTRIPFGLASAEGGAGSAPDALEVIVLDDDGLQRNLLGSMARSLGWRVTVLGSAGAFREEIGRRLNQSRLPDAMVLDVQLDGIEAPALLDSLVPQFGGREVPPIVLVSAADPAGMTCGLVPGTPEAVLAKPVSISALFNAVNLAVVRHGGSHDRVSRVTELNSGTQWLADVRVLVVDDSEVNRQVAMRILERQGAIVEVCEDGKQAVEAIARCVNAFDLVLMDVQMPVMDGYDATRAIRRDLGLTELPVVGLTAGALLSERQRAFEASMDDFVTKPLEPEGLVRVLRRHIERVRGGIVPVRASRHGAPATAPATPQIDGIDPARSAHLANGDPEMFLAMLERTLDEFSDLHASALLTAYDASPNPALGGRAHKLRGSAAALGAVRLQECAADLENAARDGRPGADIGPLLDRVREALRDLRASAAPHFALSRARNPTVIQATADPLALRRLAALLRAQDLAALASLDEDEPALLASLGEAAYGDLKRAVKSLDFPLAMALVHRHAAVDTSCGD